MEQILIQLYCLKVKSFSRKQEYLKKQSKIEGTRKAI